MSLYQTVNDIYRLIVDTDCFIILIGNACPIQDRTRINISIQIIQNYRLICLCMNCFTKPIIP